MEYFHHLQSFLLSSFGCMPRRGISGLHGNSVTHKEQMHEIWECRKELIKAYNFEDWYEWKNNVDVLKDNPTSEWYIERDEKYKECLKNVFTLLADNIRGWWD